MIFFIVGSARSGTTSFAKICDTAKNCTCLIEPHSLTAIRLSRDMMESIISDPTKWIQENIYSNYEKKKTLIYGEKDVTYGPLIPFLNQIFDDCKFIFLKRDGRDVVSSMINWHIQRSGTFYSECKEDIKLSKTAEKNKKSYEKRGDFINYGRPRPPKDHYLYKEWKNLTLAEMCAFYWSYINEIHLKNLENTNFKTVDYSSTDLYFQILEAVNFLNIKIKEEEIKNILEKKINSLKDRRTDPGPYPYWKNWDKKKLNKFYRIAGETMRKLGYENLF